MYNQTCQSFLNRRQSGTLNLLVHAMSFDMSLFCTSKTIVYSFMFAKYEVLMVLEKDYQQHLNFETMPLTTNESA